MEKTLQDKKADCTSGTKQTVAMAIAKLTNLPPELAIREISELVSSEIPREWGPMAALFGCSKIFPEIAARLFYALYTGNVHLYLAPLAENRCCGYELVILETAHGALSHCGTEIRDCATLTKGNEELSLGFTRKVMHDLLLPYAAELPAFLAKYMRNCDSLAYAFGFMLQGTDYRSFERRLFAGISNAKAQLLGKSLRTPEYMTI